MTERYDQAAAAHYAAYRPPLHQLVLSRVLTDKSRVGLGLDVGCGTGASTLALATYCEQVIGIDPSWSMLDRAEPAENVTYRHGSGDSVPLPDATIDVVAFAGSLHYANSDATRAEIRRVCREGALVVVYDFEILLDEVLGEHEMEPTASAPDYDHSANLSGAPGFVEQVVRQEQVSVEMTPKQLAHVLLSDSHQLDHVAQRYRAKDPFEPLVGALRSAASPTAIPANLFYSTYTVE